MEAIKWNGDRITVLNAQLLPEKSYYHNYKNFREIGAAVEAKVIPGVASRAAAVVMSIALTAEQSLDFKIEQFKEHLNFVIDYFEKITKNNCLTSKILATMQVAVNNAPSQKEAAKNLKDESIQFNSALSSVCEAVALNVKETIEDNDSILLFSASGSSLAAPGGGLISAALIAAHKAGKKFVVYCCETRPDFSGAKIMAYDLQSAGIDTIIIPDIQALHIMKLKKITRILLAAESLYSDGYFSAYCGTEMIVEAAKLCSLPIDLAVPEMFYNGLSSGQIVGSNRASINEVAIINNGVIAPEGIGIENYMSDFTHLDDVSRIITENDIYTSSGDLLEKISNK